MTDELKAQIREEHRRAELQRLEDGWSGCGCSDCQELYREIDLTKYGSRVVETDGIILVKEKTNMDTDRWSPDGQVFIHYGKRWAVTKKGTRIMLSDAIEKPKDATENNVTSQSTTETSEVPQTAIMLQAVKPPQKLVEGDNNVIKHRGRPVKTGEVSRMTLWRRQRQAVML